MWWYSPASTVAMRAPTRSARTSDVWGRASSDGGLTDLASAAALVRWRPTALGVGHRGELPRRRQLHLGVCQGIRPANLAPHWTKRRHVRTHVLVGAGTDQPRRVAAARGRLRRV